MHCKPKNPSHRWSAVADLHTNTCNKTDIQQNRDVKSGGGKSDATNGTRSESSTPIGSISQLVDDDGYDDGCQLRTKSIPQSRVYHNGISNDEEKDYCAEDSVRSGPSNNDSEEVAWSHRNSAYSASAAKKGRKTTAALIDTTTTAKSFLLLLLLLLQRTGASAT
jgi:hypothetical protein